MNSFLKSIIVLIVCWFIAFFVSFYTASDNLDMVERLLYSLVFAGIALIAYSLSPSGNTSKNNISKRFNNEKVLYVFEGEFGKKLIYRIQNNKVYYGLSNKYYYEIKGDKIYKAMSSKWVFQIKGNRIYRGFDKEVAYRIAGNKVYVGEFGRKVIYRIIIKRNG